MKDTYDRNRHRLPFGSLLAGLQPRFWLLAVLLVASLIAGLAVTFSDTLPPETLFLVPLVPAAVLGGMVLRRRRLTSLERAADANTPFPLWTPVSGTELAWLTPRVNESASLRSHLLALGCGAFWVLLFALEGKDDASSPLRYAGIIIAAIAAVVLAHFLIEQLWREHLGEATVCRLPVFDTYLVAWTYEGQTHEQWYATVLHRGKKYYYSIEPAQASTTEVLVVCLGWFARVYFSPPPQGK